MEGKGAGFAPSPVAWLLVLLALLLALAAYANHKSQALVSFTVHSSDLARMQVFHGADGWFAESRSQWLDVAPGAPRTVEIQGRGQEAMQLRLDPPGDAVTTVCDIRAGRADGPVQYELLHASELSVTNAGSCLRLEPDSAARDPQLTIRLVGASAAELRGATVWQRISTAILIALLAVAARIFFLVDRAGIVRAMPVLPVFDRFGQWAHWACAVLMLGFGLAYIAVTPPGAVADEEAHFAKIVRISQGAPFGDSGAQLMPSPRAMYGPFLDYLSNKDPFTREQLQSTLQKPLVCEATTTSISVAANGYFPHQYLLPAAAYMVGCATGQPFGWFLYAARFLNLLLATILVTAGVACAARGKLGLFLIALLPMSLFQMSSLSADSLVFSLGIAWLGVVSGIAGGALHPRRVAPALWALSLAIAFLKPGAAWLLVSVLFCKPAYDAAGESFITAVAKFLVLPWAIHLALVLWVSESARATAGVDAAANMHWLLGDPQGFLRILIRTFQERGHWLWETMVGVLGWLDVPLTRASYWAACLMVLAAAFANGGTVLRRPKYVVPLALLAIAGSLLLIALPLFIYWTPLGSQTIAGLQGRYFTMSAAFALVWLGLRSPRPVRALLAAFIIIGLVAINADAVYQLYDAYFVTGRG